MAWGGPGQKFTLPAVPGWNFASSSVSAFQVADSVMTVICRDTAARAQCSFSGLSLSAHCLPSSDFGHGVFLSVPGMLQPQGQKHRSRRRENAMKMKEVTHACTHAYCTPLAHTAHARSPAALHTQACIPPAAVVACRPGVARVLRTPAVKLMH